MRNTYVELFGPGDAAGGDVGGPGSIGIALGSDLQGAVDAFVARADAEVLRLDRSTRRRLFGEDEIDWFEVAAMPDQPAGTSQTVDVWAMEYVPGYFEHAAANKRAGTGATDVISRLRYNARSYDGALFEDLLAAEFAIDRNVFGARIRPMLVAAGFELEDDLERVQARCVEASLTFDFAASTGLRALRFRLNADVSPMRGEAIGRSTLSIGPGREARWAFDPV